MAIEVMVLLLGSLLVELTLRPVLAAVAQASNKVRGSSTGAAGRSTHVQRRIRVEHLWTSEVIAFIYIKPGQKR
eukprot:1140968-Pelagomonas_calceolata.AAC.1